jgi:hypothetical protein
VPGPGTGRSEAEREAMKVEVLYIEGCPNHRPALERVVSVLQENAVSVAVTEIPVASIEQAKTLGFLGSPTIRVNDADVESEAQGQSESSYSCRTYTEQGKLSGVPSQDLIRRAIHQALHQNHGR